MEVGDWVYNVPRGRHGVIVNELEPIREPGLLGNVVERRLEVLYVGGEIIVTGCTFLDKLEKTA